jgi:hypothetical protein
MLTVRHRPRLVVLSARLAAVAGDAPGGLASSSFSRTSLSFAVADMPRAKSVNSFELNTVRSAASGGYYASIPYSGHAGAVAGNISPRWRPLNSDIALTPTPGGSEGALVCGLPSSASSEMIWGAGGLLVA